MARHKVRRIKVRFTFEGYVDVFAEDRKTAIKIVEDSFGMKASIGIHASDNRIKNWEFNSNPEKKVFVKS